MLAGLGRMAPAGGFHSGTTGCLCQGWGIGVPSGSRGGPSVRADAAGESGDIDAMSFAPNATPVTSITQLMDGGTPVLRIAQVFSPSPVAPGAYRVAVTIETLRDDPPHGLHRAWMERSIASRPANDPAILFRDSGPLILGTGNDASGDEADGAPNGLAMPLANIAWGPPNLNLTVRWPIGEADALATLAAGGAGIYMPWTDGRLEGEVNDKAAELALLPIAGNGIDGLSVALFGLGLASTALAARRRHSRAPSLSQPPLPIRPPAPTCRRRPSRIRRKRPCSGSATAPPPSQGRRAGAPGSSTRRRTRAASSGGSCPTIRPGRWPSRNSALPSSGRCRSAKRSTS